MVVAAVCFELRCIRRRDERGLLRGGVGEVAAGSHVDGCVGVDGPADHHVENVAGDDPGDDEETEGVVAGVGVAHIFEEFGGLFG